MWCRILPIVFALFVAALGQRADYPVQAGPPRRAFRARRAPMCWRASSARRWADARPAGGRREPRRRRRQHRRRVVAKAAPDGYTLLMATNGKSPANQMVYAKMTFDPKLRSFRSPLRQGPKLVVPNPKCQVKSVGDLVAYAQSATREGSIRPPGVGSQSITAGDAQKLDGIEIQHVPYAEARGRHRHDGRPDRGRGGQSADRAARISSPARCGALAVAAKQRMALLPDVPTAAEAGVAELRGVVVVRRGGAGRHAACDHRKAASVDRGRGRGRRQCRSASASLAHGCSAAARRSSPLRSRPSGSNGVKLSRRQTSRRNK